MMLNELDKKFKNLETLGWDVLSINHGKEIGKVEFQKELIKLSDILMEFSLKLDEHIIKRGGGKSDQTQELTKKFENLGWIKNEITIANKVSFKKKFLEKLAQSTSHEIDHLIDAQDKLAALEIEWNNKDEFFDRDFQAFRRLYETEVIELGIIITRGSKLETNLKKTVSEYFSKNGIIDFEKFKILEERFIDRFSFPTKRQKTEIETKIKSGCTFSYACAYIFCKDKYGKQTTNWTQLQSRIERKDAGRTPLIFFGIPPNFV